MSVKKQPLTIPELVGQYRRAAIVMHFGYEDEDHDIQRAGVYSSHRAIEGLDAFGPEGRLGLVPLLDDPEPSVRVCAAGRLLKLMPERAVAVLNEIINTSRDMVHRTAVKTLRRYEEGELDL